MQIFRFVISSLLCVCSLVEIKGDSEDDVPLGECSKSQPCKEPFKVCRQESCVCKEGYVQNSADKCVKAPTVGEKCVADDGSILDCKGPGVDASCPADGPNKNKCACVAGYEAAGKTCKFKDQSLNEKCAVDADCGVAFSRCGGDCVCAIGFTADKGICVSDPKCPNGNPPKGSDGKVKVCEVKKAKKSKEQEKEEEDEEEQALEQQVLDSCPQDQFCFYHPLIRSASGSYPGYCCPRSQQDSGTNVCPVGEAKKVDGCDSDADISLSFDDDDSATKPPASPNSCPALTHSCVYAANATKPACCPSPCPAQLSAFALNGRCYATLVPGRPCKFDLQCGRHGVCQEGKNVCACKSGYTANDNFCEKNA